MQRVEEHAAEIRGGPAEGNAQIRAAHVSDKKGVAGQNGLRFVFAAGEIVHEDGDRFWSVPGSFEGLEPDVAELDHATVGQRGELYSALALAPR